METEQDKRLKWILTLALSAFCLGASLAMMLSRLM
jgi:hypothetical protein